MEKIIRASVDAGNKNLNIFVEGMKDPLVMTNCVAAVPSLTLKSPTMYIAKRETSNPINCLDLTINSNGVNLGRKYLGGLALKNSGKLRTMGTPKYNDPDIVFSVLGGIATTLVRPGENISVNIALSTCLPAGEFTQPEYVEQHEKRFVGTHKVVFNHEIFHNASVTIRIYNGNVITVAEGVAALINICTDDKGDILDEYENLLDRIVLVADIGGGTVDIVGMLNFEILGSLVNFKPKGIFYAEENILRLMKVEKPNYVILKSELDYCIRKKNCILIDREGTWDIKHIVEEQFKALSEDIAVDLKERIAALPENLQKNFGRIVLTGGSVVLLADYLTNALSEFKVIVSSECLNDNVKGAYKSLMDYFKEDDQGNNEIRKAQ